MTSRASSNRRQRGFSMVELGLSIVIMAAGSIALMAAVSKQAASIRDRSVAQNLQTIVDAERAYVKANYSSLVGSATSGAPIVINITGAASGSFQSVQTAGFLPGSFVNKNAYGQSAVMLVRQPVAGQLEVVTTTLGGAKIPDENLGNIAQLVGSAGGFMAQKPVAASTGYITGAFGGWKTLASTWTNGSNAPTVGHAMATLAFDSSTAPGQYLSRVATGTPSDNQMSTAIDMNGNDLKNAKAITATTVTASTSMSAPIYYDSTNSAYYLYPAHTSQLNGLNATYISAQGGNISGGLVVGALNTANGVVSGGDIYVSNSSSGIISEGRVEGRTFVDRDNATYFVDPSGTSVLGSVNMVGTFNSLGSVNAMTMSSGTIKLNTQAVPGAACAAGANGTLYIQNDGHLLNCIGGKIWMLSVN